MAEVLVLNVDTPLTSNYSDRVALVRLTRSIAQAGHSVRSVLTLPAVAQNIDRATIDALSLPVDDLVVVAPNIRSWAHGVICYAAEHASRIHLPIGMGPHPDEIHQEILALGFNVAPPMGSKQLVKHLGRPIGNEVRAKPIEAEPAKKLELAPGNTEPKRILVLSTNGGRNTEGTRWVLALRAMQKLLGKNDDIVERSVSREAAYHRVWRHAIGTDQWDTTVLIADTHVYGETLLYQRIAKLSRNVVVLGDPACPLTHALRAAGVRFTAHTATSLGRLDIGTLKPIRVELGAEAAVPGWGRRASPFVPAGAQMLLSGFAGSGHGGNIPPYQLPKVWRDTPEHAAVGHSILRDLPSGTPPIGDLLAILIQHPDRYASLWRPTLEHVKRYGDTECLRHLALAAADDAEGDLWRDTAHADMLVEVIQALWNEVLPGNGADQIASLAQADKLTTGKVPFAAGALVRMELRRQAIGGAPRVLEELLDPVRKWLSRTRRERSADIHDIARGVLATQDPVLSSYPGGREEWGPTMSSCLGGDIAAPDARHLPETQWASVVRQGASVALLKEASGHGAAAMWALARHVPRRSIRTKEAIRNIAWLAATSPPRSEAEVGYWERFFASRDADPLRAYAQKGLAAWPHLSAGLALHEASRARDEFEAIRDRGSATNRRSDLLKMVVRWTGQVDARDGEARRQLLDIARGMANNPHWEPSPWVTASLSEEERAYLAGRPIPRIGA